MGTSARTRRGAADPLDEVRHVLLAADTLLRVMEGLRHRVARSGVLPTCAPVLLAEAHIFEAVDILRSVASQPHSESEFVTDVRPTAAA